MSQLQPHLLMRPTTALVLVLLLLFMGADATWADEIISVAEPPTDVLQRKAVLHWTAADVEVWMNHTIGYPEYSHYIRKHVVDGPTLLEMDGGDFESFFPIESPLHAIKLNAHVKLLRGQCYCGAAPSTPHDLWSYMSAHSFRTWVSGTTALFFPRLSMLGTYLFDHDYLVSALGSSSTLSDAADPLADVGASEDGAGLLVVRSMDWAMFWISFLVAPHLYLAYHAAHFIPQNYIFMLVITIHLVVEAANEYGFWWLAYRQEMFPPGTSMLRKVWICCSYSLLYPLVAVVVALLPGFLQSAVSLVLLGLMLLGIVGGVAVLLNPPTGSVPSPAEAPAPPSTQNKEESSAEQVD